MAQQETNILKSVMLAATRAGKRMFRNNVGTGYQGIPQRFNRPTSVIVRPGDVLLRQARAINFGLHKGSGDLIGWTPVTITADMVGKTLAVFTSYEVKTSQGRVSTAQKNFVDVVTQAGGIAKVCRSPDDI